MPSRESIESYRKRQGALADAVEDALERFVRGLDLTRPETSRDALLEFVPALVDRYGPVAAEMAAEWYDELVEQAPGPRPFKATPVQANIAKTDIQATTRRLAGGLWGNPLAELLPGLLASTGKWVQQSGRDTIISNAKREGVRWARVPQGKKTCAFCLVLASRDAVYISKRTASSTRDGERFHSHCDCQAVRIASQEDYPSGYLPDDYYAMYNASAEAVGTRMDIKPIVKDMRKRFPDRVTDGN